MKIAANADAPAAGAALPYTLNLKSEPPQRLHLARADCLRQPGGASGGAAFAPRQDRFAALAPLAAVLLFLAAIVAAFWYLRAGGSASASRKPSPRRGIRAAAPAPAPAGAPGTADAHGARQCPTARWTLEEFDSRAESWSASTPSCRPSPGSTSAAASAPATRAQLSAASCASGGRVLKPGETERHLRPGPRPAAAGLRPAAGRRRDTVALLQLHVPLIDQASSAAWCWPSTPSTACCAMACPPKCWPYAVALLDAKGQVLAGTPAAGRAPATNGCCPGPPRPTNTRCRCPRWAMAWCCGRRPTAPRWAWWAAAVLAGGHAERHDRLDADRQLAPHPPAHAGAAGPGGRNQLPPRHGKLHADRHARAGPAGPHHLRERRVLPDDRLERGRAGGPAPPPSPTGPKPTATSWRRGWKTSCAAADPGGFQVRVKRKDGSLFDAGCMCRR
jgi:hypothetical protein